MNTERLFINIDKNFYRLLEAFHVSYFLKKI